MKEIKKIIKEFPMKMISIITNEDGPSSIELQTVAKYVKEIQINNDNNGNNTEELISESLIYQETDIDEIGIVNSKVIKKTDAVVETYIESAETQKISILESESMNCFYEIEGIGALKMKVFGNQMRWNTESLISIEANSGKEVELIYLNYDVDISGMKSNVEIKISHL